MVEVSPCSFLFQLKPSFINRTHLRSLNILNHHHILCKNECSSSLLPLSAYFKARNVALSLLLSFFIAVGMLPGYALATLYHAEALRLRRIIEDFRGLVQLRPFDFDLVGPAFLELRAEFTRIQVCDDAGASCQGCAACATRREATFCDSMQICSSLSLHRASLVS